MGVEIAYHPAAAMKVQKRGRLSQVIGYVDTYGYFPYRPRNKGVRHLVHLGLDLVPPCTLGVVRGANFVQGETCKIARPTGQGRALLHDRDHLGIQGHLGQPFTREDVGS